MSSEEENIISARVTRKMPKNKLEEYITDFLKTQNMCVLATCKSNMPRATPIEYYSKGTTLYMIGEQGRKIENIRANPNVSVGIFAPYTGWLSVKGVQIMGEAKIIRKEKADEFKEASSVYQWEKSAKELGIKELPENVNFLKIESQTIELLDTSLKTKGYAARQVWTK